MSDVCRRHRHDSECTRAGSWRIMNNPAVLDKLRDELFKAFPSNTTKIISSVALQELLDLVSYPSM
jgi:hypothetical protein